MGWRMLFIGGVSGRGSQSPTIWQSDGTGHGTNALNAGVGVNPQGIPELATPGGSIVFFDLDGGKIYTQSDEAQLLVWDTHQTVNAQGIPEAAPQGEWTYDVYKYTAQGNKAAALNPQGFTPFNGRVYFNGTYMGPKDLSGTVQELFTTDHLVMIPGPGGLGGGLAPISLTVAFGQLFFGGNDPSSGNNVLFAYDGSGTPSPAPGIDVNDPPFNPAYLTFVQAGPKVPASLFMSGQDSAGNTRLYQYDGKHPPTNIDPTSSGLQPYNLVSYLNGLTAPFKVNGVDVQVGQEMLFFSGVRNDTKRGLWMSLGTKDTTAEIPTKPPSTGDGSTSVYPFNLTPYGGGLYFTAYDTYINGFPSGRGLFAYDPVSNQVSEVHHSSTVQFDPGSDIPSSGGLSQTAMTEFPPTSDLYFSGSTGVDIGYANLWRANLGVPGKPPPTPVYTDENVDLSPLSLTYQWI